jgi:hypothetical protein
MARSVEADGHDEGFALKLRDEGRWAVDIDAGASVVDERGEKDGLGPKGGC